MSIMMAGVASSQGHTPHDTETLSRESLGEERRANENYAESSQLESYAQTNMATTKKICLAMTI